MAIRPIFSVTAASADSSVSGSKWSLRAARDRQVGVAHADRVGQEDGVELGGLGAPGQIHVVAEVHGRVGLRAGVAPGGDVVAGLHQEGAELDLARRAGHGVEFLVG